MKQESAHPPAVVLRYDGRSVYMGRMSVIPRKGETIWVGRRPYSIADIQWEFNTGSASWDVEIYVEE